MAFNYDDLDVTEVDEQMRNRFLALPEMNTPNSDFHDPRSDMTIISGILYFLLTGHNPGHLKDKDDILPHRRGKHSVRQHLGSDSRCEQVEVFLDRGLAGSIAHRFQSWDELKARLVKLTQPLAIGEEDPAEVAATLQRQLQSQNRRTQLSSMKETVRLVRTRLQRAIQSIYKSIEPGFGLSMGGGFHIELLPVPDDLTDLEVQLTTELRIEHHRHLCFGKYTVCARGNECVLIYASGVAGLSRKRSCCDEWQEVVCFNPNALPDDEVLKKYVSHVLTSDMKKLAAAAPDD